MLPNRFEAEDVVQETFVKVFKHLSRYKSDSSLGTWIRRIAINTALDVIRKDSKMKFVEMDNSDISDAPISEDDSFWTLEMVHESIKKLPKGNRVIFTLYALEGYDHKEIAQILGVTESTSKTQYKRAKDTLKKLMRDHYGQG